MPLTMKFQKKIQYFKPISKNKIDITKDCEYVFYDFRDPIRYRGGLAEI